MNERRDRLVSEETVKLFLVLLLVFSLFGHWIGDNENSRLDLTMAVAEQGSLSIDAYHTNTDDKARIDGRYYSDKAPLPAFLAVPGYLFVDAYFLGDPGPEEYLPGFHETLNPVVDWARFMAVASVSAVAGAVTVTLLFHIFLLLGLSWPGSLLLSALSAFGTIIFPYSTTFHGTMLGTMFLTAAIYLWLREREPSGRGLFMVGGLIGLAVASSYLTAPPGGVLLALLAYRERSGGKDWRSVLPIGAGLFVGLLPLLLYNAAIFGHPFDLTVLHQVRPETPDALYADSARIGPLNLIDVKKTAGHAFRFLVGPINGVFLFSPSLLLAVLGLRRIRSADRDLYRLVLYGSILTWIAAASTYQLSRAFFGPRYLLPAIPLLLIGVAIAVRASRRRGTVVAGLGLYSVFAMLSSTQPWRAFYPLETWNPSMGTLFLPSYLENGLIGHYLPQLLSRGLQSPLLAVLSGRTGGLDMVLSPYVDATLEVLVMADRFLLMDRALFALAFFTAAGIALVYRAGTRFLSRRTRITGLLVLVVTTPVLVLSIADAHDARWYERQEGDLMRWGKHDPSISMQGSGEREIIEFTLRASNGSRAVMVTVNDDPVRRLQVPKTATEYAVATRLRSGLNRIGFETPGRCTVIGRTANNSDSRCVTVGIANLSRVETPIDGFREGANIWVQNGTRRMTRNASIYVAAGEPFSVSMITNSVQGSTEMQVFKNGVPVTGTRVDAFGTAFRTPVMDAEDPVIVTFSTGCPDRCGLLNLFEIDIRRYTDHTDDWALGSNWYHRGDVDEYRWSMGNATIYLYNRKGTPVRKTIRIQARSFHRSRNVTFRLDGERLGTRRLAPNVDSMPRRAGPIDAVRARTVFTTLLEPGVNTLSIGSTTPCTEIGRVNNNSDVRCTSFGLADLSLTRPVETGEAGVELGSRFQPEGDTFTLTGDGSIYVYGLGSVSVELDGRSTQGEGHLNISIDDRPLAETAFDPFPFNLSTPYIHINGSHRLEADITCETEECTLAVDAISARYFRDQPEKLLYRFGEAWYRKASYETYRWSNGNATLYIYHHGNESVERTLWVSGRSFGQPRNITYRWNREPILTRTVRTTAYKIINNNSGTFHVENKYGIPVTLNPGENVLELRSPTPCSDMGAVNDNDDIRCSMFGFERMYLTNRSSP